MKKVIISTMALLVACPAFAGPNHPKQGSSWQMMGMDVYIGMRGGMTWENLKASYMDNKHTMTDVVLQGRAAMGLEVCDTVRSEVEWSIFGKAKDHNNFGTDERVEYKTKLQTLMWNNYWEFSGYQMVRPFAGLGVGAAFVDVDRTVAGVTHGSNKGRVSAMGTLGVSFDMDIFAVDLAARYNYVDAQSGLHNIGADVGVRFMF